MHQDRVLAMPCITDPPPPPLRRMLRRMLGDDLKAIRTGPSRVLCLLAGHEVDKRLVVSGIGRRLIEANNTKEDATDV